MATLAFDGDLRRIYEVPDNSSFTIDGSGYRVYVPDDVPSAASVIRYTTTFLWSRFSDYHFLNNWTTLAFEKTGGAFRFQDELGNDVFATFDLRLINAWEFVPADYPHNTLILGNLFPNIDTQRDFDTDRIISQGVSERIQFADSLQIVRENVGSGLTAEEQMKLDELWRIRGLDPNRPLTITTTQETEGEIVLDISGDGITNSTMTRRP